MTTRRGVLLLIYVCGSVAAGLAAIHFVWRYPALLGPFALPIGMTPLVLAFEYSPGLHGGWFWAGSAIAALALVGLRQDPPSPRVPVAVVRLGLLLTAFAVLVLIAASAYHRVGAAGPIPPGWTRSVRPGIAVGDAGIVIAAAGLTLRWAAARSRTAIPEIEETTTP